ncbi:unnamed protein product [Penicillium salamii]|uniref:Zn(2)-C6 fungal-type domain-containing protein n=1 Tax=Penicillium salamii TaxID=1612424 RepID=A0A9W4NV45_9EURO|nr:unnamed protein product [Penicillium salamii]
MKVSRYANSRQKSCLQCSRTKSRCDRKPDRCTRCSQRGLSCTYLGSDTPGETRLASTGNESTSPVVAPGAGASHVSSTSDFSVDSNGPNTALAAPIMDVRSILSSGPPAHAPGFSTVQVVGTTSAAAQQTDTLDFSHLNLICPLNVDDISNRWLKLYIPDDGEQVKEYPESVTRLIYRVLKSYAAVAARGRDALPFIHPTQMKTPDLHLATCLSLVRISANPLPGSEGTAATILQREMESITQSSDSYDDVSLLAAFQAYLIYTMVLFFRLNQGDKPLFRSAMMNLQQLACSSSRKGLICTADSTHIRPRWEEWIMTEAKRRTLYVMYLFDSTLSANEGLPTFLGSELQGLPAPSNKPLWQAENRAEWEKEFNILLAEWTEGVLNIDELWPIPSDIDNAGVLRRRTRVDQWLENLDEFGTMMFAVTSCTHHG